jgi:hypothetical protein
MSMSAVPVNAPNYNDIVDAVRLELQEAGNPAFIVALVDADGRVHVAPMIFSAVGPSNDHALRMLPGLGPGERLLLVSRHASRRRQAFNVLEPKTLRKLHVLDEVIEAAFIETDGPV